MKKKVLLTSIMTIAICFCVIAGSTFALFTDSSSLGIEVTAGDVTIDANITDLALWSVTPNAAGTIVDELGGHYIYENQTALSRDTFLNTGYAGFDGNVLQIVNITPGDKVSFSLQGINTSNVSILMRVVIELDPTTTNELAKAMVLNVGGTDYTGVSSYTSVWVPVSVGSNMVPAAIELGLPVTTGDTYQNAGANYIVRVEAVQGNAATNYTQPIIAYVN